MKLIDINQASPSELARSINIGPGTPLANPFLENDKVTQDDDLAAIKTYRTYLINKIVSRDPFVEVAMRNLCPDSILVCPLKSPKDFHGKVIMEFWEVLFSKESYEAGLLAFKDKYSKERILFKVEDDGITHINVYSKAKTRLGQLLSNFAHTPFEHPEYGHFSSVEGFWYWLSLGMDKGEFRGLYGFKAKQVGKLVREEIQKNGTSVPVVNFEGKIKKAILCKIEQNPELREMLKDCKLPLTHYYHWGEGDQVKITYPKDYAWVHEYIDLVRKWLNFRAFKVVIAGSRSITSREAVKEALEKSGYIPVEIVSGMAPGVDRLAVWLSEELKLPLAEFPADWESSPKAAGFIRNTEMAKYADKGVLLWDGVSNGTNHMRNQLEKFNKDFYLQIIRPNKDGSPADTANPVSLEITTF